MIRSIFLGLAFLTVLFPVSNITSAKQSDTIYQYAVKVVCGKSEGRVVAPGQYFTAINIHNPTTDAISFRKKFVVAFPDEKPGPVTPFFGTRLGADEAVEIDCPEIFGRLPNVGDFIKGFVVIESEVDLDVVAVYTAGPGQVATMDVERVAARRIAVQYPDLVVRSIDRVEFLAGTPNLRVTFTVANVGSAAAGASITRISTDNGVPIDVATPALAAGASVALTTTVLQQKNCYDPDCTVCGTADSANAVTESDETNNKTCRTIPG
jgi:hypothetical protein